MASLSRGNFGTGVRKFRIQINRILRESTPRNSDNFFESCDNRLPSYSTIRRVMMGIDLANLIEIFNEWAAENYPQKTEQDWLAVDGKSLRSTVTNFGDNQQNFVAVVSLFSQSTGWVVRL